MYSQQGQGFHAVPQDQTFQKAPEVPQVQFSQQAPLLQLLPVEHYNHYSLVMVHSTRLIHVWALQGILWSHFVNKERYIYILCYSLNVSLSPNKRVQCLYQKIIEKQIFSDMVCVHARPCAADTNKTG